MKTTHPPRTSPKSRYPILVLILVLISSLVFPAPAMARPLALGVVHYVSPAGSDAGDCTNPTAPCLTINYTIGQSAAEDVINVAIGVYTGSSAEVVLIDKNLTLHGGWNADFTTQSGTSTIDGGDARRGMTVPVGVTASIDHFKVQNGFNTAEGGGIWNAGTLTLSNSVVTSSSSLTGGGIYNTGTLTIDQSTLSNNAAGRSSDTGYGGGALENYGGTVTINASTLNGNAVLGSYTGSAIDTYSGSLILNNTTITGNTSSDAIFQYSGEIQINNSSIAANPGGGLWVNGGGARMRNSILAQNAGATTYDCFGTLISEGYNILGDNNGCTFTAATGDQVGTPAAPINPRLGKLSDHGGPTKTRALSETSPALNAGNPATPGGDPPACPATDQRGEPRGDPVGDICDIGAYEGSVTLVHSVTRLNNSPTSAQNVYFTVTFSSPVTGVHTAAPFSDFKLSTAISDARVREVTGSGTTYTVKVFTGTGNGSIRLDVKDLDTILNGSAEPLGGAGLGNGAFNTGQVYTLTRIPKTVSPGGLVWDNTPAFKWTRVPQATQYSIQLMKGTTVVYNKTIGSGTCSGARCSTTPTTVLTPGGYKWRVRAMTQGSWKAYSSYKTFTVDKPKAGFWPGDYAGFFVKPDRVNIYHFTVLVYIPACNDNTYKIDNPVAVPIVNRSFAFSGGYSASGTFSSSTQASGQWQLDYYYIEGCGLVSSTVINWNATWSDESQPGIIPMQPGAAGMPSTASSGLPAGTIPAWLVKPEAAAP